jgi:hypothetical protein
MNFVPRAQLERPFRRLGRSALRDRLYAMRALADVRGLRYVDDHGRPRIIETALIPWVLTSDQLYCFHWVAQQLSGALLRLAHLYAHLPAVREVVPFDPERESWMRLCRHPRSRPLAVIGRLDSTASYGHARWREAFRMLEPNGVGVGGVHYAPTGCSIALDVVGDLLLRALPGRAITATPDPRQLLVDELASVARRLRRPLGAVALIENMDFTTGTDEFQELAEHLAGRGIPAVVADPRQLRIRRGAYYAGKTRVDLLYRDSELSEFVEMERGARPLTAMRQAVREGRLISGLTWEFDQKSAWEIFTDSRYARYFTRAQRQLFREHLLWTRLVRPAWVTDPSGRRVDLIAYIRRNRRRLVLKPNALFGGEGVVIGHTVGQAAWDRALRKALRGKERYVVQSAASIPSEAFPALMDGHVHWRERHVVSGFYFSSTGVGLVGRFSGAPVVNVSRGGGLVPALWVH